MTDPAGQIGLVHTHGLPARIIQVVTASHWNHVVIGLDDTFCVGAEPGGVRVRPITDFPEIAWSSFPLTRIQRGKIRTFTLKQLGKPYNWRDDILIGLGLLFRAHTPHWMLRELSEESSWQCAQLGLAALTHGGMNVFADDRPTGAVYPASFVPLFREFGWLPDV